MRTTLYVKELDVVSKPWTNRKMANILQNMLQVYQRQWLRLVPISHYFSNLGNKRLYERTNIILDSTCNLCNENVQDIVHLFHECPISGILWSIGSIGLTKQLEDKIMEIFTWCICYMPFRPHSPFKTARSPF